MLPITAFTSDWKRLHHPTMSVDSDVAFYYDLYGRLHRLVGQETLDSDERFILPLLLYTENTIAVGLDGVYEYLYRSVGDVVFHGCDGLGLNANTASQVRHLVSQAVADAPCSALRQWITGSVLSGDFLRVSEMLTFSAREDQILRLVYPDLRYRRSLFRQLISDENTAMQMLWSDIAFNWRDKHGHSLSDTLAKQCRRTAPLTDESERASLLDAAKALDSICSERLDTYTVISRKSAGNFALRHRDGRVFTDVTFTMYVPEHIPSRHLAAQLVTYLGKTYAIGPAAWLTDEACAAWKGDNRWNDLFPKEREAAKQASFTTSFGKRISLYEDLYTVPQDSEAAYDADMGIYWDEPNLFDFLEWLKPSLLTSPSIQ